MARHVAFFRNLNLGQRGSPTRDQLLAAFDELGADDPRSFRTNGTVVFGSRAPVHTVRLVRTRLRDVSGWDDVAPVREAGWVRDVVGALGEVGDHAEVSLYDARTDFPEPLPWRPARGRVTVVQADRRHAVAVNDAPRTSYATPELERLWGVRVTSRALSTMERLVDLLR